MSPGCSGVELEQERDKNGKKKLLQLEGPEIKASDYQGQGENA